MKTKGIMLAENLKKLRRNSGYSMADVAGKLGLSSHGVYANWEYGRNEPNIATLISISELYGISIDELVGNRRPGDVNGTDDNNIHREVIELIPNLSTDDVKLIKKIIDKFRGYSFSKHLSL